MPKLAVVIAAAALAPCALGFAYSDGPMKELVSTEALAMKIIAWSTIPNLPDLNECTGFYDAEVVPAGNIPIEVFFARFYRIKEWSDDTTTMDILETAAGIAPAFGVFEFFGKTIEELWAELPIATKFEHYYVYDDPFITGNGGNWWTNVTVELVSDVPVFKSESVAVPGRVFYSAKADQEHLIKPYISLLHTSEVQVYHTDELVQIYKEANGDWHHLTQQHMSLNAYGPDWMTDPSLIRNVYPSKLDTLFWYANPQMNGTKYGGMGNPPFVKLDPTIEQTYL